MGDMNLDYMQWSSLPSGQKDLVDTMTGFMVDLSLEQVVDKPTRLADLGNKFVRTLVDHC